MPKSLPISAFVITYNEEGNIYECLKSLDFCDEIIIVDSNSADNTCNIAEKFKQVKIIKQEFLGYRDQKNLALSHCSNSWVISLDADERISTELQNKITALYNNNILQDNDNVIQGYNIPRLHWFLGKWIKGSGLYPDHKLRLFRKQSGNLVGDNIHEVVKVSGSISTLDENIIHYSWIDIQDFISRQLKYADKVAHVRFEAGKTTNIYLAIWNLIYTFLYRYIIRQGICDGAHGFIIAFVFAVASAYKILKLWQLNQQSMTSLTQLRLCPIVKLLLKPAQCIYLLVLQLKYALYKFNILKAYAIQSSNTKIISIGNLSCGGTGKTPLILQLYKYLHAQEYTSYIIMRGYKNKTSNIPLEVNDNHTVEEIGDEAYMLFREGCHNIIISPNRVQAIQLLESKIKTNNLQIDYILLDDGFQRLNVKTDINICLLDASDKLGFDILPAGNLRENFQQVSRASHIVITRSQIYPKLTQKYQKLLTQHKINAQVLYTKDSQLNIVNCEKTKTIVIAGIGNPEQFVCQLKNNNNINIVGELLFADHYNYNSQDVQQIIDLALASEAQQVITTQKDIAKLNQFDLHEQLLNYNKNLIICTSHLDYSDVISEILPK